VTEDPAVFENPPLAKASSSSFRIVGASSCAYARSVIVVLE
jgi:hypothetical protein